MKTGILFGIAASLISFGALAAGGSAMTPPSQSMPKSHAPSFQKLDTNGDGHISKQEARKDPRLQGQFAQADKDGNGKVERGEFAKFELHTQSSGRGPAGSGAGSAR